MEISEEVITSKIYLIREKKVMLDRDLAVLYQVETRALKQQVRRNIDRFPEDFMFELSDKELNDLVSQNVIPSRGIFEGALYTDQTDVAMLRACLTVILL